MDRNRKLKQSTGQKGNEMKIAVSGKGGVGKTTFASLLIRSFNEQGKHVLAIDADPDANLAAALGIADADKITPISEMKDLVAERTESQPGSIGGYFKLNPKVDDLPEALSARLENIKLMRLGGVKKGRRRLYLPREHPAEGPDHPRGPGPGRSGGHGHGSRHRAPGQSNGPIRG